MSPILPEDESSEYKPLDPGTYGGVIEDVEETTSKAGAPQWVLKISTTIPNIGKRIIWDRVTFSTGGVGKVFYLLRSVGIDKKPGDEILPKDVLGKYTTFQLIGKTYWKDNRNVETNEIPYDGYQEGTGANPLITSPQTSKAKETTPPDDDLPF